MKEHLGIKRLEALHFYVHDLARTRAFLTEKFDFAEVGHSDAALDARGRQHCAVFEAKECRFLVSEPRGIGGRAWRHLQKHPEGVGTMIFEVEDIQKTFKLLNERRATFITDIEHASNEQGGKLSMFSISTPFGSTTMRFVQRENYDAPFPGFVEIKGAKDKPHNRYRFLHIDHITSNFITMRPALLWMEHVLGFEEYWDVQFHTNDVTQSSTKGSGLKSIVMHDPYSGVKFANNEPLRPFFTKSQINIFVEENRGEGVQHAALTVPNIIDTVRDMRTRSIEFMPTPGSYYDMLPEIIQRSGIEYIDEDLNILRELEILIDGEKKHKYLLQIFLKENATQHKDVKAGPFFFEIIQRKGDRGFGAGNFRSLFESIERQQRKEGKV